MKAFYISFTLIYMILMLKELKNILIEEKAQSEWSALYLLLVFIIAALVLLAIVKPMFQQAQKTVTKTKEEIVKSQ